MTEPSRSPMLWGRLRVTLNNWRAAFIVFALVYLVILMLNLTNMPMQWDEVTHLNGAMYLNSGLYTKYLSNSFYPPLYDALTALFFQVFGVGLFSARLVSGVFSVLSLWAVFELAYSMYDGKTALLAAIFLGVMPGYFWLSRLALLETMLLFFVMLALLLFYRWLQSRNDTYVVLAGFAVGLGFLTKYQAIIAGIIMVLSILFLAKGQLKRLFTRFSFAVAAAVVVIVPWIVISYQEYASKTLSQWLYALQIGNPEKSVYSDRYPSPIFYLIDVVWPYNTIHPISLFLYILGLVGLAFLVWRRNKSDKFTIIWFISVYVFFTFISNREWRYVSPLFPALAISSAVLILFLYKKLDLSRQKQLTANKKRNARIACFALIALTVGAMAYSVYDAYTIVSFYDIKIQLEPATVYAMNRMLNNQSIMVLAPFNLFNADMIKFYLWKDGDRQIQTYQYPTLPVDTYTPNFNITELIIQCRQFNVKFLFTYEEGGTVPYYNTTLSLQQIYVQLYNSGEFSQISSEAIFGVNPRRILILTFLG